MSALNLLRARAAFFNLARPSISYCRHLGLDWLEVEAHAGGVFMLPIQPDGAFFGFDPEGIEAAVISILAEDASTTTDFLAWLPSNPAEWWQVIGTAPALGLAHAVNPATYASNLPLQLYLTPEQWLVERCYGAVLLGLNAGTEWLTKLPLAHTIAVRDDVHARQIDGARRRLGLSRHQRLVVPAPDFQEVA